MSDLTHDSVHPAAHTALLYVSTDEVYGSIASGAWTPCWASASSSVCRSKNSSSAACGERLPARSVAEAVNS